MVYSEGFRGLNLNWPNCGNKYISDLLGQLATLTLIATLVNDHSASKGVSGASLINEHTLLEKWFEGQGSSSSSLTP